MWPVSLDFLLALFQIQMEYVDTGFHFEDCAACFEPEKELCSPFWQVRDGAPWEQLGNTGAVFMNGLWSDKD